MADTEPSVPVE